MALSLFNTRDMFSYPDELLGPLIRPDTTLSTAFRDLAMPRAMPLDVKETETTIEVKADVPGVSKEDIHVSVEGNVLTLKVESGGEKKEDTEEDGVKWHRVERHSSFVQRSLRMPANAELDKVHAKYDNGVLFLEVPKKKTDGNKDTKRITVE